MFETSRLMEGFPPSAEHQVTLANWRTSPFNRWAFHHVREVIPSADIPNDSSTHLPLPSDPVDLGALSIESTGGTPLSLRTFLDDTSTDGFVIVRNGRVLFEHYANGMTAGSPHILMSVSKSLLGLLAGVLALRGELPLDRPVTDVIPEIDDTAYHGATIRQLLDMRTGVEFDENYLATSGPIISYRKAANWNVLEPGETPSDLRSFYRLLTKASGPHGGPIHYVSPNTDLLGWVIERATGRRYADLMSDLIWRPLGAAHSAYITVDRLGAPRCAGGFCATVRDLARVGVLIADNGWRNGTPIIPERWIEDIIGGGDPEAWAAGDLAEYFPAGPMRYRSQWYVAEGAAPVVFGFGIHGQFLLVDRVHRIVIAKVSSQAMPIDTERITLTMRAVSRIRESLAGSSR
jgi:CubicO group peptidase (beta-lactamase class C family)